jgi:hypothetical protein
LRIGEQFAIPSLKVARRCDLISLGVERRAFGDSPVRRDPFAVNAQARAGRHGDEAVVLQFTEPPLHRSCRFRAEIGGSLAVGSEDLSVVQIVYPQVASQSDVQAPRARISGTNGGRWPLLRWRAPLIASSAGSRELDRGRAPRSVANQTKSHRWSGVVDWAAAPSDAAPHCRAW